MSTECKPLTSYCPTPLSLQHNVSHNLHFFQQSWFPSEHLRFTHGLRLALDLVDPKRKDPALTGILGQLKLLRTRKRPRTGQLTRASNSLALFLLTLLFSHRTRKPLSRLRFLLPKAKEKGRLEQRRPTNEVSALALSKGPPRKPCKPDSKVIVTNEVVSEDETTKLTAEQKSALNKKRKDMAAGRLLRRPETSLFTRVNPWLKPNILPCTLIIGNKDRTWHTQVALPWPTVTKIIPNHTREGLPVDDSGRFYALPPDILSTAVGSSVPTDGPRCTSCQLAGSLCITRGRGQPCERCNSSHTASACEFTFSDEVLNDLAPERTLWFDMSSPGWLRAAEDLEVANENYALAQRARDSAEKEMRYKALVLLHRIVRARAEMEHNAFVARFAGDTTEDRIVKMEYCLRLAMVQGITARRYFTGDGSGTCSTQTCSLRLFPASLTRTISTTPTTKNKLTTPNSNKLGYYLVPKPGEKGEAVWIEIQPSDLATIPLRD
ncbi:hypothetical protein B0H14DRAFT_2656194, partial [Mycena olivaceomarginata]